MATPASPLHGGAIADVSPTSVGEDGESMLPLMEFTWFASLTVSETLSVWRS